MSSIEVKAKRDGFYGKLRKAGDVFVFNGHANDGKLPKNDEDWPRWMEPLEKKASGKGKGKGKPDGEVTTQSGDGNQPPKGGGGGGTSQP